MTLTATPQAPTAVTATSVEAAASGQAATPGRRHAGLAILALVLALLAPLFLNTATASARGRTSTEITIARSVLTTLNTERHAHGLRPLVMDYRLIVSARRHNLAMAAAQTMSHQLPGEAPFTTRILRAGYHWTWAGENIGWHSVMTATAANQLETMMYNEKAPNDGHRRNILNTHFTNIGVDIYLDQAHHKLWLTTDFGRP